MRTVVVAAAAALALSACQAAETKAPAEAEPAATTAAAPAGSDAAVARILAMPLMQRCGSEDPNLPTPTATQVVDLSGGVFAVLADCQAPEGQPVPRALFVQGPDGVLKYQPLLIYNGAGYDPDYTWEGAQAVPLSWDAAASQLVSTYPTGARPAEEGVEASKASEATIRWRWAGDHFAMVSSTYTVQDTPGGPFTPNGVWPTTPPIADPTAPLQPVT